MRTRLAVWTLAATAACGGAAPTGPSAPPEDTSDADSAVLADAASDNAAVDSASETAADASPEVSVNTCLFAASTEPGVIATDRGLVRGQKVDGGWMWRGIPYAAPPLGDLRWKPPQPHACFADTVNALAFGAKCPQKNPTTGALEGSEDCLTLNVFTPPPLVDKPNPPLPVLVFIHGGGNVQGSTSESIASTTKPIYAGQHLAGAAHAVVVTLQYRLGPLGWLSLPELSTESGKKSGNQGLQDQLFALNWVQKNISAFGGDPQHVLVFGESAGAVDTCALLTSPAAKGLFAAALMESGNCSQPKQETAQTAMAARVAQGSCGTVADRLTCLRGLDQKTLLTELGGSIGIGEVSFTPDPGKYGPVVDGDLLPQSPLDALTAGTFNQVPFVVGCNGQELAKLLTLKVTTDADLQKTIAAAFATLAPENLAKVQAMYASAKYPSPQDALIAVFSDVRFVCPTRSIARAAVKVAKSPVWRYFFTRQATGPKATVPASHGLELLYVFGSLHDIPLYEPSAFDVMLAEAMQRYWGNLAAMGTPNAAADVAWPPYDAVTDAFLEFAESPKAGAGVRTAECDLWATLIPGY